MSLHPPPHNVLTAGPQLMGEPSQMMGNLPERSRKRYLKKRTTSGPLKVHPHFAVHKGSGRIPWQKSLICVLLPLDIRATIDRERIDSLRRTRGA